jgi:hypothetical protein
MAVMITATAVWRRAAAAFTLLALLVTTSVSAAHTAGDADAAHAVAVAHDAQAHVFTDAPAPPSAPLHCLACHAARSFRPALDVTIAAAPSSEAEAAASWRDGAPRSSTRQTRPPLRAPPIFSSALA